MGLFVDFELFHQTKSILICPWSLTLLMYPIIFTSMLFHSSTTCIDKFKAATIFFVSGKLSRLGFQIELSTIRIPSRPNLIVDIGPIRNLAKNLYRRLRYRSIFDLFLIKFNYFWSIFDYKIKIIQLKDQKSKLKLKKSTFWIC